MTNINVRNYIDESYGLFINNEFQASDSGETLTVSNPANVRFSQSCTRW